MTELVAKEIFEPSKIVFGAIVAKVQGWPTILLVPHSLPLFDMCMAIGVVASELSPCMET